MGLLRGPYRFWIKMPGSQIENNERAYHVEIGFCALWPWSYIKMHRPGWGRRKSGFYRHFLWGRFSLIIDQPQIETCRVCAYCNGEIESKSYGDESWDYCSQCETVEGDTSEISEWEMEQGVLFSGERI